MNPLLLGSLADIIKSFVSRILPDPAQQADAQLKLAQLVQSGELAQLAAETDLAKAQIGVDNTEAQSESSFKSYWRPAVGWVCCSAFAWGYVLRPMLSFGLAVSGINVTLPPLDMSEIMPVLIGMLGLGAYRTTEKLKGMQ